MSPHRKGSHWPATTEKCPRARTQRPRSRRSPTEDGRASPHSKNVQMPFRGSPQSVLLIAVAAVFESTPENFYTATLCGSVGREGIPRTAIGSKPPEDNQMPAACGLGARPIAPGAAVLPQPHEHFQMTAPCSRGAGPLVPRTVVRPTLLDNVQVTPRSRQTGRRVPRTVVLPQPSKNIQMATPCMFSSSRKQQFRLSHRRTSR